MLIPLVSIRSHGLPCVCLDYLGIHQTAPCIPVGGSGRRVHIVPLHREHGHRGGILQHVLARVRLHMPRTSLHKLVLAETLWMEERARSQRATRTSFVLVIQAKMKA